MKKDASKDEIAISIVHTLKEAKKDVFAEIMSELRPYDIAIQFRELPIKHRPLFLEYLTVEKISELLRHLNKQEQSGVLNALGPEKSVDVLQLMKDKDLTNILSGFSKRKLDEFISTMKQEEANLIRRILAYPRNAAGRIMSNRYICVSLDDTVEQATAKLRDMMHLADFLHYIYVLDDDKKLTGVVSYKDLLLGKPDDTMSFIMSTNVVKAQDLDKQEEIAKLFARYDFVTLPIIDKGGVLVGVVTVDDVLDIVYREANEDIEKLFASGKSIDFQTKPLTAAYRRLPWLILLLFIGLISGSIISRFEDTLAQVVALAFFMPMIAGMTGNTGTQSLAVVVRGLVSEDLNMKKIFRLVFRELSVGITLGIVCGGVISVIAFVWQGNFTLGMVVGCSLLLTLIIGTLAGTIIPLILYKFNVDPAVASGPLITTINDILSLLIYFGIANMFLSKLG
ncbi:MAG TPA: magnesium transporter [Bacillaceae bacterium]